MYLFIKSQIAKKKIEGENVGQELTGNKAQKEGTKTLPLLTEKRGKDLRETEIFAPQLE